MLGSDCHLDKFGPALGSNSGVSIPESLAKDGEEKAIKRLRIEGFYCMMQLRGCI